MHQVEASGRGRGALDGAREVVERYLREATRLDYEGLRRVQRAPWPSVACGAAGVAYAVLRAGSASPESLARVDGLLADAERASAWDYAFQDDAPNSDGYRSSLYYGPLGVHFVRALVAHERRDERQCAASLAAFLDGAFETRFENDELLQGDAGLLNGMRILHGAVHASALVREGEALAERLTERAHAGVEPSGALARPGFGHGAAGVLHALLAWEEHVGRAPSSGLEEALWSFAAREDRRAREAGGTEDWLRRTWCNGASGRALLWVKAYEVTGDERFRERAEADGVEILSAVEANSVDLCCGLGGRAYACLALARIDPDRGWEDRSRSLVRRNAALLARVRGAWPNGLFKGLPGFACLVRDLDAPSALRAGFPLVES